MFDDLYTSSTEITRQDRILESLKYYCLVGYFGTFELEPDNVDQLIEACLDIFEIEKSREDGKDSLSMLFHEYYDAQDSKYYLPRAAAELIEDELESYTGL